MEETNREDRPPAAAEVDEAPSPDPQNGHGSAAVVTRVLQFSATQNGATQSAAGKKSSHFFSPMYRQRCLHICRKRHSARILQKSQVDEHIGELRRQFQAEKAAIAYLSAEVDGLRREFASRADLEVFDTASIQAAVQSLAESVMSKTEYERHLVEYDEIESRSRCLKVAWDDLSNSCTSLLDCEADVQSVLEEQEAALIPLREKVCSFLPEAQHAFSCFLEVEEPSDLWLLSIAEAEQTLLRRHEEKSSALLDLLSHLLRVATEALHDKHLQHSHSAAAEELLRERSRVQALQQDAEEAARVINDLSRYALETQAVAEKKEIEVLQNSELHEIVHSISSQSRNIEQKSLESYVQQIESDCSRQSEATLKLQLEEIPVMRQALSQLEKASEDDGEHLITMSVTETDAEKLRDTPYAPLLDLWGAQHRESSQRIEELARQKHEESAESGIDVAECQSHCEALERQVVNLTVELAGTIEEQLKYKDSAEIDSLHDAEAQLQLLQEHINFLRRGCAASKAVKKKADKVLQARVQVRAQHLENQQQLQQEINSLRSSTYSLDDELSTLMAEEDQYEDLYEDEPGTVPNAVAVVAQPVSYEMKNANNISSSSSNTVVNDSRRGWLSTIASFFTSGRQSSAAAIAGDLPTQV